MEKTPAFHAAGVVPTFAATSPTSLLIWSNIPSKLPMMQSRRMPLIQSVIMSRMFSIGYVLLAEQVRQQGDELHTDQGNTAARHELLHALRLCSCEIKK